MEKRISSLENQTLKDILKLKNKKYRYKENTYLIEGYRLVMDALKHRAPVAQILVSDVFDLSDSGKAFKKVFSSCESLIDYIILPEKIFDKLADTETPQGVLAAVRIKEYNFTNLMKEFKHKPFIITLDCVQDPGNLGTILRTAEAAGVDFAIIIKGTTDPYSEKAVRASMGATFTLPIVQLESSAELQKLEEYQVTHYVSSLQNASSYSELSYDGGTNLIIGNEGFGVSEEIKNISHHTIKIPIYGKMESLNASVAAGILLYKIAEKRLS